MPRELHNRFDLIRERKNIINRLKELSKTHDIVKKFLEDLQKREKITSHELIMAKKIVDYHENLDKYIEEKIRADKKHFASYIPFANKRFLKNELAELFEKYWDVDLNEQIDIGLKIANIAKNMGDWRSEIQILKDMDENEELKRHLTAKDRAKVKKELGIALTKHFKPSDQKYIEGINKIKKAIEIYPDDSDAFASLGGQWKKQGEHKKAYKSYLKALDKNEYDSYPLLNVLIYEIKNKTNKILKKKKNEGSDKAKDLINEIIKEREDQIREAIKVREKNDVPSFMDLPWVFYDLGALYLLFGNISESLNYYSMAIKCSYNFWTIETNIATWNLIHEIFDLIDGLEYIIAFFYLAMGFLMKYYKETHEPQFQDIIDNLKSFGFIENRPNFKNLVLIIAGALKGSTTEKVECQNHLKNSFDAIKLSTIYAHAEIDFLNYLNKLLKEKDSLNGYLYILKNQKGEISSSNFAQFSKIFIQDNTFSYYSVLQYWFDILCSDVPANNIKVLCFDRDNCDQLEFKISIALGAHAALLNRSSEYKALKEDNIWTEIVTNKIENPEIIPFRLFKNIEFNEKAIANFLNSKFYRVYYNENILSIQINHKFGTRLYLNNFTTIESLDRYQFEVLKDKQIPKKVYEDGKVSLVQKFPGNQELIIRFLFRHSPSDLLKRQMNYFIKLCDEELGEQLILYYQNPNIFEQSNPNFPEDEINKLLERVFGSELF